MIPHIEGGGEGVPQFPAVASTPEFTHSNRIDIYFEEKSTERRIIGTSAKKAP